MVIYVNELPFPDQTERDLTSLSLAEVAYPQTSHMCNSKFQRRTKRESRVDSEGPKAADCLEQTLPITWS